MARSLIATLVGTRPISGSLEPQGVMAMSELCEKMAADLRLKGFRPNTQDAYLRCLRRFANHFGRSPDRLGEARCARSSTS